MRHFLGGPLRWVALGLGMLALAAGISVTVWLVQRDNGPDPGSVTGEGVPEVVETGGELPGSPARDTNVDRESGAASSPSSGATVDDSAELEVQRSGRAPDDAEAVQIENTGGSGPGLTASDGATLSDSVELSVEEVKPVPRRGSGDVASVSDIAELVVRDASGKIKQQQIVR